MTHLTSSDSQSVQNYLDSCHIGVKEHKIVFKLQAITSNCNVVPKEERSKALDSTDRQLQGIMKIHKINAEKRTGSIEFSPEPSKLGLRWHFWRKAVHHKQGRFKTAKYLPSTEK